MDLKIIKPYQWSLERSHDLLINLKNNSIQDLCLLDKNKSLGHLDTKIGKTKIMKIFTICATRCNSDNKTQSFKIWPEPFIKSFTSSSGSFLQIKIWKYLS